MSNHSDVITRVKAEFSEMPCLRLTMPQAQRLFGLCPEVSGAVMQALVQERFLHQSESGVFMRQAHR